MRSTGVCRLWVRPYFPSSVLQDQIVRSGNDCFLSLRLASIDENKTHPSKGYYGSQRTRHMGHINIYFLNFIQQWVKALAIPFLYQPPTRSGIRNTHADTQIHRIHSCINKRNERKRNNICRDESLSQTTNTNWTFTEANPGIKKNHNPPFQNSCHNKNHKNTKINHLLPKDYLKRQKYVLKKKK